MKKIFLLLFFISLSGSTFAQPADFLKSFTVTAAYTTTNNNGIYGMWPQGTATLSPSSFIVGGYYSRSPKNVTDTLIYDSYLLKNRTDGYTHWFRKYHLNGRFMSFNDVGVLYNSDILAAGSNYGYNNQMDRDGILMVTDSNGTVKSVRIFPNREITKVKVLSNKKVAIVSTDSLEFINLTLLDKNGTLLWNKQLFHTDSSCCSYTPYDVEEGANSSILVVGSKLVMNTTNYTNYPFALLCDSSGNKINDFVMPFNMSSFWTGTNYYNKGFYLVGTGVNAGNNLSAHCARIDNQLQIKWYKLYQSNMTHVEFSDVVIYGPNNINVLTEPETAQGTPRRAGFSFMDSMGVIRRTSLFNPTNNDQFPDKMFPIANGKVLFTLFSNAGRLFGVTDTMPKGFCNRDTLSFSVSNNTIAPLYNTITLVNQSFNYFNDQVHVYLPKDAQVIYKCSTGPSGPMDTTIIIITGGRMEMETEEDERFQIHPNPVMDYLMITSNRANRSPSEMSVSNSEGKKVIKMPINLYALPYYLDVRHLPKGIYFLSIRNARGKEWTKKFVVSGQ